MLATLYLRQGMINYFQHITKCLLALVFLISSQLDMCGQFYNGSEQSFGKNRVQYKKFDWLYYPTDNFDVYFYNGGKDLAEYTAEFSETSIQQIEDLLDHSLTERAQIVVYNSQTDFRQSNVGIEENSQENVGGKIPIVGSKLFVYFEGDHKQLQLQIKEGLARINIQQLLYGGSWKSVLRSSTTMYIPEWYIEGLVSYASQNWDSDKAKFIRDGIKTGAYTTFNEIEGIHKKYAGHAFWKFIGEVYGDNVIPNILYMNKISRNMEDGFLFVLGKDLESIFNEYADFWLKKTRLEDSKYPNLEINRLYTADHLKKIESWKPIDDEELSKAKSKLAQASVNKDSKQFKKLNYLVNNWSVLGYEGKKWRKLDKKFEKYLGAIPVKSKKKYTYSQFRRSPNGEYVSFVTHEYGQYKIWLYHISSGKLRKIIKKEAKIDRVQDKSYPNLVWHPSGKILTFITEKRGRVFINFHNLLENKTESKELFRIDKVLDMSYAADGKKIVFSGVAQGQTDLYIYSTLGNNQTRLTNDFYDDLEPEFIPGTESIIFSTNRPDDTLRTKVPVGISSNFKDIYILHLDENEKRLEQISRTPDLDESEPQALTDKFYSYLTFENGFKNLYAAQVDSTISRIDTVIHYRYFTAVSQLSDYAEQLGDYQVNSELNTYGYTIYRNGRLNYNWGEIDKTGKISEVRLPFQEESARSEVQNYPDFLTEEKAPLEDGIDTDNYVFEDEATEYNYEKEVVRIGEFQDESALDSLGQLEFKLPKSRNYRLNFTLDEVTTQIDNSLNFEMYRYRPLGASSGLGQGQMQRQGQGSGLGGMAKGADLFEDYKVKGIARINFQRTNNDFALIFSDLSKRLDKEYSLMRYARLENVLQGTGLSEIQQYLGRYKLIYAIDELYSVRGSALGLLTENILFASDNFTSSLGSARDIMAGGRFSFVFDNTRKKGFNLLDGTRYKLFAESYYFNGVLADTDFYLSQSQSQAGNFNTIGFDFRHYENLYKDFTIALRGAGVTSFGNRLLLNNIGGVDNELFGGVADTRPQISESDGFAYISQPTQIRGFRNMTRVGSNFALANVEARWPVVKFFSKKPLNSEFAQTFTLIGFYDIGSAWNGRDPYSMENNFNNISFEGNPVSVTIRNNTEPLIWSYGFGARAKIMGYFIKADLGWGVDNGVLQKPLLHVSFMQDF